MGPLLGFGSSVVGPAPGSWGVPALGLVSRNGHGSPFRLTSRVGRGPLLRLCSRVDRWSPIGLVSRKECGSPFGFHSRVGRIPVKYSRVGRGSSFGLVKFEKRAWVPVWAPFESGVMESTRQSRDQFGRPWSYRFRSGWSQDLGPLASLGRS